MPNIVINNFRCLFEYNQQESGAPCVIFLNGILSALESWLPQARLAADLGYNVLQYEYRGQWRSEVTPGPYSMQTHADDLMVLMNALGISRAHLVGTSYGGMVAMKFASQHPDAAASLMLIATTALIRPLPRNIVTNWCRPASQNDIEGLFMTMLPDIYSERFLDQQRTQIAERLIVLKQAIQELPDFCAGQMLLNQAQFPELGDGSLLAALSNIRCRALVVAGELDRLYPPSDSREIATRIADAESIIVAQAGHGVVAERPEAINLLLAGHLMKEQNQKN